uniref:Uncharacterized protein n=1 Tax=viral metagenome TaxID=1070528 RepID=A0A6M3LTL3_9ZZZZ
MTRDEWAMVAGGLYAEARKHRSKAQKAVDLSPAMQDLRAQLVDIETLARQSGWSAGLLSEKKRLRREIDGVYAGRRETLIEMCHRYASERYSNYRLYADIGLSDETRRFARAIVERASLESDVVAHEILAAIAEEVA